MIGSRLSPKGVALSYRPKLHVCRLGGVCHDAVVQSALPGRNSHPRVSGARASTPYAGLVQCQTSEANLCRSPLAQFVLAAALLSLKVAFRSVFIRSHPKAVRLLPDIPRPPFPYSLPSSITDETVRLCYK
jgi:hypothetical protein